MIVCSAPPRCTISMTRCAAGSPFIPMNWSGFTLATRPGPSPSPTGLGSGRTRRERDGASISVWVSRHWVVRHIEHLYEEGIAAGSDHAPVMVDLELAGGPGKEEERRLGRALFSRPLIEDRSLRDPYGWSRSVLLDDFVLRPIARCFGIEVGRLRIFQRQQARCIRRTSGNPCARVPSERTMSAEAMKSRSRRQGERKPWTSDCKASMRS